MKSWKCKLGHKVWLGNVMDKVMGDFCEVEKEYGHGDEER